MKTALDSMLVFMLSGIVSWVLYVILNKKYMISRKLNEIIPGKYKLKLFIWNKIVMILMIVIAILCLFVFRMSEGLIFIALGAIATIGKKIYNDLKFMDGI
ncbi:hypothetical protein [Clostridium sp. C8-1-8]|uniref:hypothetical protein n=1 Tax=Clostridium sp. C8-1-8 TaxID=2698831 RepID=UPI0013691299|nr:hypothetical protein [Clostridium sp. C8-1-8]